MDDLRHCAVWRRGFDLRLRRSVYAPANPGRHANSDGFRDSPADSRSYASVYPSPDGCSYPCAHSDSSPNRHAKTHCNTYTNARPDTRTHTGTHTGTHA